MTEKVAPLLQVKNLSVRFTQGAVQNDVVRAVNFAIHRGETLALVGESGSGKSVTALSILQLLPPATASYPSGSIQFDGTEMIQANDTTLRAIRGTRVGVIFQEPMTSLNPLHTVEKQIGEMLVLHRGYNVKQARPKVLELLEMVGIDTPHLRLSAYPHQLSGGQRQRVMIAMALANEPDLLIADEPTTALDVTIQAQILHLLADLRDRLGMAVLFITHDLGIVEKMADRVCVMQDGKIVEQGPVSDIFQNPNNATTRMLLAATPSGQKPPPPSEAEPLLEIRDLKVWFPIKGGVFRRTRGHFKAVNGVDLSIKQGQTIGVVGESGSGKTSLGLAILGLQKAQGTVRFRDQTISGGALSKNPTLRRHLQLVFQDPYGSLSPRMTVGDIIAEGLKVHFPQMPVESCNQQVAAVLDEVALPADIHTRYPHEFSGGQRQRIAIARALILKPEFLILDEPTSALDMSVQSQILDLLRDLQTRHGLTYLFISHDLKVVRAMSDYVLVMKDGLVIEEDNVARIFDSPQNPYTQNLLAAALHPI